MGRLDVARIEAAQILEAEAVLDLDRLRQRLGGQRPGGDARGGGEVLLHQHRRHRQHLADVVESFARVVGREVAVGAEFDPEQVANRVGVLGAIEPARGDPPRIRLHAGVGARELRLEELDQGVDLLGRPLDVLRRHLASLELAEDDLPPVALGRQRLHRVVEAEIEAAFEIERVVALAAGLVEEPLGRGGERLVTRRTRRRRGPAARAAPTLEAPPLPSSGRMASVSLAPPAGPGRTTGRPRR